MLNLVKGEWFRKAAKAVKPWLAMLVILLVLRYTGILSGMSFLAHQALVSSGAIDIDPEANVTAQNFHYDFSVRELEGRVIDVNAFKGKVIFLNMWATWCGPCRAEMPSIQQLYDSIDHEQVAFIMLSLDFDENRPKVIRYVKERSFTFPVYQPATPLPDQLQVPSIPTTFVIGKDGKVKMKKVGTANYSTEKFRLFLEELIAEPQKEEGK
jgi:thiol-disulfide isomerase/thioredoxin